MMRWNSNIDACVKTSNICVCVCVLFDMPDYSSRTQLGDGITTPVASQMNK